MNEHKCHHLLDELSDYLDGELPQTVCDEIEQHMANCENCRVVIDTMRQTVQLYHTLPQPDMPQKVRQRLFKSLDLDDFLNV